MRIECPECRTVYEVPDHLLGPKRKLRCAHCGHIWPAEHPAAANPAEPSDAPALPRNPPEPAAAAVAETHIVEPLHRYSVEAFDIGPRPKASAFVWVGWAASLLVLALLVWGALAYRDDVMAAWPESERLYHALGLVGKQG